MWILTSQHRIRLDVDPDPALLPHGGMGLPRGKGQFGVKSEPRVLTRPASTWGNSAGSGTQTGAKPMGGGTGRCPKSGGRVSQK